jgi:hypothetical protein
MNKKLEKFQVEELEQRFETGRWVSKVKVTVSYNDFGVGATFEPPI